MAGIGQSSVPPSDQSTPWNSSQFSMGRSTTIDNHSNIQNKYFSEKRRLMPEENGILPPNMYQYSRQPTGFQSSSSNVMANDKSFLTGVPNYNLYMDMPSQSKQGFSTRMSQFGEPPGHSYLSPTPHRTISGGSMNPGANQLFNGQNMASKNRPGSYNLDSHSVSLLNQWDTHIGNFDSSEFPSLKPKPTTLFSQMSASSGMTSSSYRSVGQINYQLVTKGAVPINVAPGEHISEFSIQQEDFPALPVAQNPPTGAESSQRSSSASGMTVPVAVNSCDNSSQSHNSSIVDSNDFLAQKTYMLDCSDQGVLMMPPPPPPPLQLTLPLLMPPPATNNSSQPHTKAHKKIYHGPNNTIFDIPNDMVADAFGLIGLVKLLAINDTYENLSLLAPGLDTLSLNRELDSTKDIYPSYVSSLFSNCAGRPHDMDHAVPKEYRIRHVLMDRLAEPLPEKLSDETLFWIFYNLTGEECQLTAARQLTMRQWRYNKKDRFWLTRDPSGTEPITSQSCERGTYIVWDYEKSKRVSRQLTVSYKDLDYPVSGTGSSSSNKLTLPFCGGGKRPGSTSGGVSGVPLLGGVGPGAMRSSTKTMAAFLQPGGASNATVSGGGVIEASPQVRAAAATTTGSSSNQVSSVSQ